jgi:glycosyltransferase involved in cell wall biosynthesis
MFGWRHDMDTVFPDSDIAVFMGWPTMFPAFPMHAERKIALTMWESSRIPNEWADILNTMDAVITPSTFCRDLFEKSGVSVPVHLIPLGVSEAYQPVRRDPTRTPMRFLAFLDRGKRKGGHVALAAFQQAFGNNPAYQLVLKMRPRGPKVQLFPGGNIELIQQDMNEAELCELYQSCDVFIGATSGEGFGILPREASSCGCFTLATDWAGTHDDIEEWGFPLDYKLVPADWSGQPGLEGQELGEWAEVCPCELADTLTDVAEYRTVFTEVAFNRAGNAHKLYSWPRFADQVHDVLRGDA